MKHEEHELNGLACSLPLVKLAMQIKKIKPGNEVMFTSDNPGFEDDVILWCKKTGNHICNIEKTNHRTSVIIRKAS